MVADLDLPVEIAVCPIVREPDGLAMSSRNRYLSAEERRQALILSRALEAVKAAASVGERSVKVLIEIARASFGDEPAVRIDYIAAVDWATLEPVETAGPGTLFAVAGFVGKTRLIDNLVFE
jgi:pantoate--beta-alanine ligase